MSALRRGFVGKRYTQEWLRERILEGFYSVKLGFRFSGFFRESTPENIQKIEKIPKGFDPVKGIEFFRRKSIFKRPG